MSKKIKTRLPIEIFIFLSHSVLYNCQICQMFKCQITFQEYFYQCQIIKHFYWATFKCCWFLWYSVVFLHRFMFKTGCSMRSHWGEKNYSPCYPKVTITITTAIVYFVNSLCKFTERLCKTKKIFSLWQAIFLATVGFFWQSYFHLQIWTLEWSPIPKKRIQDQDQETVSRSDYQ